MRISKRELKEIIVQEMTQFNKQLKEGKLNEGLGSALLPTWKIFIKGYKKPFRVAAMDSRDAKRVAHEMMRNNKVKIQKVVKEATILDGRVPHAIILELFTIIGVGTQIRK